MAHLGLAFLGKQKPGRFSRIESVCVCVHADNRHLVVRGCVGGCICGFG